MNRLYLPETSYAELLPPRPASIFRRRLLGWYRDNRRSFPLRGFRHRITHHRITVHLFRSGADPAEIRTEGCRWVDRDRGRGKVLSSLFLKALERGKAPEA